MPLLPLKQPPFVDDYLCSYICSRHVGLRCKLGGGAIVLPNPVTVHDDFPVVSLEWLHPVFCADARGVSSRLLGQKGEPHGTCTFTCSMLLKKMKAVDDDIVYLSPDGFLLLLP